MNDSGLRARSPLPRLQDVAWRGRAHHQLGPVQTMSGSFQRLHRIMRQEILIWKLSMWRMVSCQHIFVLIYCQKCLVGHMNVTAIFYLWPLRWKHRAAYRTFECGWAIVDTLGCLGCRWWCVVCCMPCTAWPMNRSCQGLHSMYVLRSQYKKECALVLYIGHVDMIFSGFWATLKVSWYTLRQRILESWDAAESTPELDQFCWWSYGSLGWITYLLLFSPYVSLHWLIGGNSW